MRVTVDYQMLQRYRDNIAKLNEGQIQQFTEAAVKELAARLLRKVVMRTPVGKRPSGMSDTIEVEGASGKKRKFLTARAATLQAVWAGYIGGTLRRNWTVGEVVKNGEEFSIEVFNPIYYALYVEFGHRGVFVPTLGKTLHLNRRWTPGKFMLFISTQEMKRDGPAILERKLSAFVKEVFHG